jgi:hypothetical protein
MVVHNSWSGWCSHISSPYCMSSLFFHFRGGWPLHSVQSIILHDPLELPTTCFAIFPLKISYRVFLSIPPLPRCGCCPELRPLMPFVVEQVRYNTKTSLPLYTERNKGYWLTPRKEMESVSQKRMNSCTWSEHWDKKQLISMNLMQVVYFMWKNRMKCCEPSRY